MPQAYVYAGLAGDTGPGKPANGGLYRSRAGSAPPSVMT